MSAFVCSIARYRRTRHVCSLVATLLLLAAPSIHAADAPSAQPSTQPATQPTTEATSETPVINASDAASLQAKQGKEVTVKGEVFKAELSSTGKVLRINFKNTKDSGFFAVIFQSNLRAFEEKFGPDLPAALAGKTIEVTGKLADYRGKPEIILATPLQLKIQ